MKRIACLLCLLTLILCSCAKLTEQEKAVLQTLERDYPHSEITRLGKEFRIVTENEKFENTEIQSLESLSNRAVYTHAEDLLGSIDPLNYAIFVGEKTGESKQFIPINSETGQVSGLFYTNSKVRVKKVYYGDLTAGDVITVKEFYAVFSGDKRKVITYENIVGSGEYLLVAHKDPYESLYGEDSYYSLLQDGIVKLETYKNIQESDTKIQAQLYKKYVINNDTAIDIQEEIHKAERYFFERNQLITDSQISKINDLAKKYGTISAK